MEETTRPQMDAEKANPLNKMVGRKYLFVGKVVAHNGGGMVQVELAPDFRQWIPVDALSKQSKRRRKDKLATVCPCSPTAGLQMGPKMAETAPALDVAKYLANGGGHCPFCGSKSVSADGHPEADGMTATNRVYCYTCQKEWVDIWTLTGVMPCP